MNRRSGALVAVLAAAPWIALLLAAGPVAGAAPAATPAGQLDGKAIFLAQKCNLCHAVSTAAIERTSKSEKVKGPDLAGVAKRREPAWIRRWVTKQESLNGKKHLHAFKGTPQELEALVAWLGKQ